VARNFDGHFNGKEADPPRAGRHCNFPLPLRRDYYRIGTVPLRDITNPYQYKKLTLSMSPISVNSKHLLRRPNNRLFMRRLTLDHMYIIPYSITWMLSDTVVLASTHQPVQLP